MKNKLSKVLVAIALAVSTMAGVVMPAPSVNAAEDLFSSMSLSPMSQKIVLSPGDSYTDTVTVHNSSNNGAAIKYVAEADSFFVDSNHQVMIGTENDYTKMKDWIVIENGEGTLPAGKSAEVRYTIKVPKDAVAGGQYAAISVSTVPSANTAEGGVGIQEVLRISSTIYASISGASVLTGNIKDNSVPSLTLTSPLTASFTIENTGNVHGTVTSYLQVFPLFSDEEVYTTEENPQSTLVMPGTSRYVTNSWDGSPALGMFRVIQTIEAFGNKSVNEKIVLICPLWFIVAVVALVAVCIFWLISRALRRKKVD